MNLNNIDPPSNKSEKRILGRFIAQASTSEPLTIYVGSCPDYSHRDGLYTHEAVGSGVPLLTQVHVEQDLELLRALDLGSVPYEYVVMVADTEATDDVFCKKFTGGCESEFLVRCCRSTGETQLVLNEAKQHFGLTGKLRSSSFFEEFGRDRFSSCENGYSKILHAAYQQNGSFRSRVTLDIGARMDMYRKMYDGILGDLHHSEREEFLVGRTMRTMAQYLALGRLIGESATHPVIIVHPTRNKGMFNSRNKFLLPGDGNHPQPTIPVFQMKRRVY